MEKELRVLKVSELRVKYGKDDNKPMITGYAAVFNKLSEDLGYFREKIEPGAFKAAIKISDARALFNHNPDYVLGRQSNETLRLKEDDKGLYMEVDPPDTQFIRDLVIAPIERGDIREQSFGFIVESDKWENLDEKSDKEPIRTILKIAELFDVSPVTFPAYPDTAVAVRSLDVAKEAMDTPPFVPLSIPELLRSYADVYDDAGNEKKLVDQLMTELKERFSNADPSNGGNMADPSNGQNNGDLSNAEMVKARERRNERLKKIDKEYPV